MFVCVEIGGSWCVVSRQCGILFLTHTPRHTVDLCDEECLTHVIPKQLLPNLFYSSL